MIFASLRFASTGWLLAGILVALLAVWRNRRRPPATLAFSSATLLNSPAVKRQRGPGRRLTGLRLASFALLVLALARPQIEKSETREDSRGINLMLDLDFSGTMRTRDFFLDGRRLSRSDGLKKISAEFIQARPADRVGVVTFDRDAALISPLTLDHDWLLERLRLETNGSGTDIGSSLLVSAEHLQQHSNETRVIVLMTDAENISGGPAPETVAEALRPLNIRLYAVQLLSPNQSMAMGDLSEMLTRVAVRTGGAFYRVHDGADLRAVYGAIDRLEKQKLTEQRQKAWRELFPWLAVPLLTLLMLEQILAHTCWRRLP